MRFSHRKVLNSENLIQKFFLISLSNTHTNLVDCSNNKLFKPHLVKFNEYARGDKNSF